MFPVNNEHLHLIVLVEYFWFPLYFYLFIGVNMVPANKSYIFIIKIPIEKSNFLYYIFTKKYEYRF